MLNHPLSDLISQTELLENIADQHGTPTYVYSKKRLEENIDTLSRAISSNFINYQIYYAVKANSNIHIIKTLKSRFNDLGCDCSSPGELFAAKKAGFNICRIAFILETMSHSRIYKPHMMLVQKSI